MAKEAAALGAHLGQVPLQPPVELRQAPAPQNGAAGGVEVLQARVGLLLNCRPGQRGREADRPS